MSSEFLMFCDLETTGLDPVLDRVMEIGAVMATPDLEVVGQPFQSVVGMDTDMWDRLKGSKVPLRMHTTNGLLNACRSSHVTLAGAQTALLRWLDDCVGHAPDSTVYLAGSGVATFDSRFVDAQMQVLRSRLHYACIDIGVLRRSLRMFGVPSPTVSASSGDAKAHRALSDALAHLEEARGIRDFLRVSAGVG